MSGEMEIFLELLREVRDEQKKLADAFLLHSNNEKNLENALSQHINESRERSELIIKGFAGCDLDGHRRYHETIIEWRELRNKIVRESLINAAKAGFLGAIIWVSWALFNALKLEFFK